MPLSRPDVVAAALDILDTYGLADLTMRRIAGALDVHVGGLYHHVPNKQTLLAALADAILTDLPEHRAQTAPDLVTTWAYAFRSALLSHRDGAELVASVLSMRLSDRSPITHLTDLLEETGIRNAHLIASTVVHFTLGHVMDEQGHTQLVALGVAQPDDQDPEELFAGGLHLLLHGMGRDSR
ncbi:TetR family transcriptional regulator [Mariniluteicoccus flavus]